jgi:hypothetical protein
MKTDMLNANTTKSPAKPQFKIKRFLFVTIPAQKITILGVALIAFGSMGLYFISDSTAATYGVSEEAETGSLSSPDLLVTDSGASQGAAVRFRELDSVPTPLPIVKAVQ